MLDIQYLRESSETWEIFDQKLGNQRIRSRSWEWQGGKSKRKAGQFYRNPEKVGVGRGMVLNVGTILRGRCWRVRLE